jgi:hypothetical protein
MTADKTTIIQEVYAAGKAVPAVGAGFLPHRNFLRRRNEVEPLSGRARCSETAVV